MSRARRWYVCLSCEQLTYCPGRVLPVRCSHCQRTTTMISVTQVLAELRQLRAVHKRTARRLDREAT